MFGSILPRISVLTVLTLAVTSLADGQTVKQDGHEYSVNPQVLADKILEEVEEIRGLEFKKGINAENQTLEEFDEYVDRELKDQMPEARMKHLGRVVQKLGLYRGPVIDDVVELTKNVFRSQAAAYYDPKTETFYVLMTDMPPLMLNTIYAHELYHGLQDQYFDLDEYMLSKAGGDELNDDELLARQAVVEGEATLIMTLWMLKNSLGTEPDREMLTTAVNMQAAMDTNMLRQMAKSNALASEITGNSMRDAIDALDDIPPFMIETLMGAYTKGMKFVFEVQGLGWEKVEELYENPPVSTEQILYPKKWIEGETPVKFEWDEFENEPLLKEWELLDANTLGEIQWRVIFNEFGMSGKSKQAAQGWDGDRYAVFGKGDDELLLLATSWDSEADAAEFADAYADLLTTKYAGQSEPTRIVQEGQFVYVVEGGSPSNIDKLVEFAKRVKKSEYE